MDENKSINRLFFELLQLSLGTRKELSHYPNLSEWQYIYELADEQAVLGFMRCGFDQLSKEQLPPRKPLLLQWIGVAHKILLRNIVMDDAVVSLSRAMEDRHIRFLLFKGQTIARLYPQASFRQSGDIDFLVHQDDVQNALLWLEEQPAESIEDNTTEKHVGFRLGDVRYELHKKLVSFAYPKHRLYWERVVMPDIWKSSSSVIINGRCIPTFSPLYNVLYVFVHIYQHLMSEGIGLRQFVDWYYSIEHVHFSIETRSLLKKHLTGIGLYKAFCGIGAILTDYLGMDETIFPFQISDKAHRQAPALVKNILDLGSFGHNRVYIQKRGVIHGLQHLFFITRQVLVFGHYAPVEAAWKIPGLFLWWGVKILRKGKISYSH